MKVGDYVEIELESGVKDTGIIIREYTFTGDERIPGDAVIYDVMCDKMNRIASADPEMLMVISAAR